MAGWRLAETSQHRHFRLPDVIIAATAEAYGATVLHHDADYDRIARVTGQPTEWIAEKGSLTAVSVRLPARPLTLDDVAELADGDPDHRYELQEGNLLVMPPADAEHAEMIMRIGAWLINGGYSGRVLATPGMRAGSSGRSPDVVVRRTSGGGRAVWIEPTDVLLTIEIVWPGSIVLDRYLKPVEYAEAGVPHFWRVERDGRATGPSVRAGHWRRRPARVRSPWRGPA